MITTQLQSSVAAVIVNYHCADMTVRTVRSLISSAGPTVNVVVVDNSCDAREFARLRNALGGQEGVVVSVSHGGNIGYGAGINRGIEQAEKSFPEMTHVLAINPDVELAEDVVAKLLQQSHQTPRSMVSPLITYRHGGEHRVWFAGGDVDLKSMRVRHWQYGRPVHRRGPTNVIETDFLSGAALLAERSIWKELGGFREDYFLYWEDVEMSLRAKNAGIALLICPAARLTHDESATSRTSDAPRSSTYLHYTMRNRIRMAFELGGWRQLRHPEFILVTGRMLASPLRWQASGLTRAHGIAASARGLGSAVTYLSRGPGGTPGREGPRWRNARTRSETIALQLFRAVEAKAGLKGTWLNHYSILHANWVSLSKMDFVGFDGTLLQLLLRAGGRKFARSSADLTLPEVLKLGAVAGWRIALVGGRPGIAEQAALKLENVVFTVDGYGGIDGDIYRNLRESNAKVVLVGLGAGLQDDFAVEASRAVPDCAFITVGGWLDQLALKANYFPGWVHCLRLGWLWRLIHEPRRLFRRYSLDAVSAVINARKVYRKLDELDLRPGEHGLVSPRVPAAEL